MQGGYKMKIHHYFAYAFAFTGGALVLLLKGSDLFSLDYHLRGKKPNRLRSVAVRTARIGIRSE
jgi:hypothetical protein